MPEELNNAAPADNAAQEPKNDLAGGNPTNNEPGDVTVNDNGGGKQEPKEPETGTEGNKPEPKTGEGENKKKEPEPDDKADYGDFDIPKDISVDKEGLDSFKALAKELGLTKENAQKLVDIQTGMAMKAAKAQQDEFAKFQEELKTKCAEKFGDKLETYRTDAAKALDRFGGEELRKVLDDFGMGNHPVLVEAFAKIGREISEDQTVLSQSKAAMDITPAQALYGKK